MEAGPPPRRPRGPLRRRRPGSHPQRRPGPRPGPIPALPPGLPEHGRPRGPAGRLGLSQGHSITNLEFAPLEKPRRRFDHGVSAERHRHAPGLHAAAGPENRAVVAHEGRVNRRRREAGVQRAGRRDHDRRLLTRHPLDWPSRSQQAALASAEAHPRGQHGAALDVDELELAGHAPGGRSEEGSVRMDAGTLRARGQSTPGRPGTIAFAGRNLSRKLLDILARRRILG